MIVANKFDHHRGRGQSGLQLARSHPERPAGTAKPRHVTCRGLLQLVEFLLQSGFGQFPAFDIRLGEAFGLGTL